MTLAHPCVWALPAPWHEAIIRRAMWRFNWGVFWAVLAATVPLGILAAAVSYKIHNLLVSIDSTLAEMHSAVMRSRILGI